MNLGEKLSRRIDMLEGVKVNKQEDIKDEITLEGNDLNNVSLSGMKIIIEYVNLITCFFIK